MSFFVKVIGGALPVGGYFAWVTYFFAGTGFAMPIVIAMIAGGSALLAFQNEIITWICEKGYACPKCSKQRWEAVS
ncbi:hypothetical protein [Photobacterium ganghwense]|uniref:hypothetical protein n=1 Tax=Photobacterium ganghwense TaxID=320778 RepID=UPI0020C3B288|nr:hypothetical protein [Photobacterium ganghwense]